MILQKLIFLISLLILVACNDSRYEATPDDFAGVNGEAPKSLIVTYERTFVVEEKRYVKALGEVHQFLHENSFLPFYKQCFSDVLDLHVISSRDKLEKTFPCIAINAAYQGELPTIYFTARVLKVGHHQMDGQTPITVEVRLYGKESSKTNSDDTDMKKIIRAFVATVEPHL